jgi:hypothetical protein
MLDRPPPQCQPAVRADRSQRYRQRQREGRMVASVEVASAHLSWSRRDGARKPTTPIPTSSDARSRLLQINPEIANQTTVLAT